MGEKIELPVVTEKPMTIYLNSNEIVTAMTLGDWPKEMAVGFLYNQNFIKTLNEIETIDYDDDLSVVVVRTKKHTNYEIKLKKQIRTSGCAQGTIYADIMEKFKTISLNKSIRITTNQLFSLSKKINEDNIVLWSHGGTWLEYLELPALKQGDALIISPGSDQKSFKVEGILPISFWRALHIKM